MNGFLISLYQITSLTFFNTLSVHRTETSQDLQANKGSIFLARFLKSGNISVEMRPILFYEMIFYLLSLVLKFLP